MALCTWVDCSNAATVPQRDNNGAQWADLCAEHDAKINKAIDSGDAKALLSGWIKAQGGAKAATRRMIYE